MLKICQTQAFPMSSHFFISLAVLLCYNGTEVISLNNRVNFDLERKLRRFTIPNLMQYIVIGQGIVFLLMMIWPSVGYQVYQMITLNRAQIFRLQLWRLVTFVFVPPSSSPLFILFALYFYYFIGQGLERLWGSTRFCLFYYIGMLGAILAALITGSAGNSYLNLSLFFAYAAMWPDEQVLLFMIIPVKMKYLAILDAVLFLWQFIKGPFSVRITILLSLANVFLFVGGDLVRTIRDEIQDYRIRRNWRR